jgi:uncharacterized protein (TIGR02611 family)
VSAPSEPAIVQRLRARQVAHRRRGLLYRGAWVVAGLVVLLAGIAMLALPGPAFVVIPVGLAILSLEFEWAERLLEQALVQADRARRSARAATPAQRLATVGLVAVLAAAAVAAAIVWDIPYVPV